jgi:signal transduction histidine kinase
MIHPWVPASKVGLAGRVRPESDGRPARGTGEFVAAWQFDRDAAQVRCARRQARDALVGWGLAEFADVAEHVVSELVTNAVRYGAGLVGVRLAASSGTLRIEVHDDGDARPVRRPASADDECGRGLAVIDGLITEHGGAREVTSDGDGSGKTVSVTLTIAQPGLAAVGSPRPAPSCDDYLR